VHPLGLTGVRRFAERMQGPFNETTEPVLALLAMQGTPLGVGPCPCEACEACPLVGLALMRLRIRARVAFEPL
jgi:hypothetical protein